MYDKPAGHAFLEEVNADFFQYGMLNDARQENWKQEREMFGFDSRETWALDFCFLSWLYERLRFFHQCNNIATESEFEKFEIDGTKVSLQESIDTMIADCKYLMTHDDFKPDYHPTFDRLLKYFSETIRRLWW